MEKSENLMWVIILGLIGFNLLDFNFTLLGIIRFGLESEWNFFVKDMILINPILWVNVKIVSSSLILFSGFAEWETRKVNFIIASFIYAVLMGLLSYSNLLWLFLLLQNI